MKTHMDIQQMEEMFLCGQKLYSWQVDQAGALLPDITGQPAVAAADLIKLPDQLDGILHGPSTGVGAEILRLILCHPADHHHPRKRFIHRHLNKRIGLVIHQHRIVFGTVLFDQITLQHQRLQLGICYDIFKPGDMGHHLLNLHALIPAALKILPHPVFQADRLAHINYGVFIVMHDIHSRTCRKFLQLFFYVKHATLPFLFFQRKKNCYIKLSSAYPFNAAVPYSVIYSWSLPEEFSSSFVF